MAAKCKERKKLKIPGNDDNCVPVGEPLLPQGIIVKILRRMPVKHLLRMWCVCKQWNDLILDRYCIEKHMNLANRIVVIYIYIYNNY